MNVREAKEKGKKKKKKNYLNARNNAINQHGVITIASVPDGRKARV